MSDDLKERLQRLGEQGGGAAILFDALARIKDLERPCASCTSDNPCSFGALTRIAELEAQLKAGREALEEADDALGLVQQSRASLELSERSRGYIQDARDKIAAIRPKPTATGETT